MTLKMASELCKEFDVHPSGMIVLTPNVNMITFVETPYNIGHVSLVSGEAYRVK